MKNQISFTSLSRLLLWGSAASVAGFYAVMWQRTAPGGVAAGSALRLSYDEDSAKTPMVSIIVPARNEERNIRRCVTSLLEQDYTNYEVIVVDDNSTDATASVLEEIAEQHPHGDRLYVLRLRELPEGWAGKPHALHSGVQEARGKWLLFTDADTWHAPSALRTSINEALDRNLDFLTLGTQQELTSFWERVTMPMAYLGIGMLYPPKLVNDPNNKLAIANGQYIMLKKAAYDEMGGYARPELRDTLLDDRDLAVVAKANGLRMLFADGRSLVHVHMYDGLREIWRGWRKNAFLGNRGGLPFLLLQLVGLPMVTIVPFFLPLLGMLPRQRSGRRKGLKPVSQTEANAATALALAPLLAYRVWENQELKVPWYYALTHPLAGAIFEGILSQSTWRVLTRKGVDWRGREYYTRDSK